MGVYQARYGELSSAIDHLAVARLVFDPRADPGDPAAVDGDVHVPAKPSPLHDRGVFDQHGFPIYRHRR
jgi:hypothetical protein